MTKIYTITRSGKDWVISAENTKVLICQEKEGAKNIITAAARSLFAGQRDDAPADHRMIQPASVAN